MSRFNYYWRLFVGEIPGFFIILIAICGFLFGYIIHPYYNYVCYYDVPPYVFHSDYKIKSVCYKDINETSCYAKSCVFLGGGYTAFFEFNSYIAHDFNKTRMFINFDEDLILTNKS